MGSVFRRATASYDITKLTASNWLLEMRHILDIIERDFEKSGKLNDLAHSVNCYLDIDGWDARMVMQIFIQSIYSPSPLEKE